jgi:DNA-binding NarL/FixJ family response regulator
VLPQQQPGLKVGADAVDAEDLLAQTEETRPCPVLLDWELPGVAAVDLLSAFRGACPDLLVIALRGRRDAHQAGGADAFLSRADAPEWLLVSIDDCRHR